MIYKGTQNDIRLHIRMKGYDQNDEYKSDNTRFSNIDPKLMLQVFDSLENALYESDKRDVETFFSQYSDSFSINSITKDAAIHRIREHRHNRLKLTEAKTGSIEILGFVIAASYFVLNSTLAESFKEGYKQSQLHKNLTDFTKRQIDSKSLFIAERIRRVFSKKKRNIEVKSIPATKDEPHIIDITVYGNSLQKDKKQPFLTIGETINKESEI